IWASEIVRPSSGVHASGAEGSGAERRGVRHAAAASSRTCCTPRSTYAVGSGVAARARGGTAKASTAASATHERSLRATAHPSTSEPPSPLGLEEELGLIVVNQQAHFLSEGLVPSERRVGVDDVEGHLPRAAHPLAVSAKRGQLEVAPPFLPCAQDRALAADLEVDLGQLEAVGGALDGLQALLGIGG